MMEFRYDRAADAASAIDLFARADHAKYLGGGTNLVDLMRENIERPDAVVDVTGLSRDIQMREGEGLIIGAGVSNTDIARHRQVREHFPLLAQAIVSGASGQIRN